MNMEGMIFMPTADEITMAQTYAMKVANANFIGTAHETESATSLHYENSSV